MEAQNKIILFLATVLILENGADFFCQMMSWQGVVRVPVCNSKVKAQCSFPPKHKILSVSCVAPQDLNYAGANMRSPSIGFWIYGQQATGKYSFVSSGCRNGDYQRSSKKMMC